MKIFVFGSNLAGRHGKGVAVDARMMYGAVMGVGEGRTGNAYAIPTKDMYIRTRALGAIDLSVQTFIRYAKEHPELEFYVTRIGCGLAGYTDAQIAPMFREAPENCLLPKGWRSTSHGQGADQLDEAKQQDRNPDRTLAEGRRDGADEG